MSEETTVTLPGGDVGTIVKHPHRQASIKPCPSCGKVAGEEFVTDPPLLDYAYWWRCRCGNIWALMDRGVVSVPNMEFKK